MVMPPPPRFGPRQRSPPWWRGWAVSILIFAVIIICAKPPSSEEESSIDNIGGSSNLQPPPAKKVLSEGDVLVKCGLSTPFDPENESSAAKGILDITVHRSLAPHASNAFLEMVRSHHFDHNYLFRVVEGFIVQWGIESPKEVGEDKKHKTKLPKADIDPPPAAGAETIRSNIRGTMNFAGGRSASGQVYINRKDNKYLDKEAGSLPFATLDERSMAIVDSVYSYKEGQGQVKAVKKGDDEVKSMFPRMSRIEKCWIDGDDQSESIS